MLTFELINIFCVQTGGKSRIACLCVERHGVNCASASKSGEMFIPPETWLPAANYALARNATFSTNLDTSHSSQSPPCRAWYTIYYSLIPAREMRFWGSGAKQQKGSIPPSMMTSFNKTYFSTLVQGNQSFLLFCVRPRNRISFRGM